MPLLPAAGHDQMWLLYAADLVRHGTKLYGLQLFESNPPLIAWISVTPLRSASGSIRYRYRQTAGLRQGEQLSPSVASGCCEAWVRSRLVLDERCQGAVHCQVLDDRHDDLLARFRRDQRFRDELSASIPTFRSDPLSSAVQSN